MIKYTISQTMLNNNCMQHKKTNSKTLIRKLTLLNGETSRELTPFLTLYKQGLKTKINRIINL